MYCFQSDCRKRFTLNRKQRERIMEVVEELGYAPNKTAVGLKEKKTGQDRFTRQ